MNDKYLTVIEVAEILKLSKATVRELVRNGEISSVQFGGSRRIPASAIEWSGTADGGDKTLPNAQLSE